jgi:O-antigen/teichoic acid export membrane protein
MVGRSLDGVLAGRLLGSVAVGLMTMGTKLIFFPVERLCGAIYAVFLPATVELSDTDRQRAAFQSTLRLLLIVIAPISLGTVAVAPEIVALLPPKWAGLVPLLRVYALTALILPVNYLSLSVLVAHGLGRILLRTALILIPICWTGATVGALSGSVLAMVVAWSFCIIVGASVAFWFAWRQIALKTSIWLDMAAPVGMSLAMAVGVQLVVHSVGMDRRPVGFFVGVGVGILSYAALARVFMSADVFRAVDLFRRAIARRSSVSPSS